MKSIWIVTLFSLAAGTAVGIGATWEEFRNETIGFGTLANLDETPIPGASLPDIADKKQPRLVILSERSYDFGHMEMSTKESHDFIVANDGQAPLVITIGTSTCKCTVGRNKKTGGDEIIVQPGQQEVITLTWTAISSPGEFRQSAPFRTNDPREREFELSIHGIVTTTLSVYPPDVVFTALSPREATTAEVGVYGYRREPIDLLGCELEKGPGSEFFDVTCVPMPPDTKFPFAGATSGWWVRLAVKPGLPLGAIQQKILLQTSYDTDRKLVVPVRGNVTSDLKVYGQDWDAEQGMLTFGTVASSEGAQRKLFLVTRHKPIKVDVEEVDPGTVQVEVGEPVETGSGGAVRIPVTISVPQGADAVDRLGGAAGPLGQVLLKTSHPDAAHVRILVRFLVQ
jgi:hypothetical protein